MKLIAFPLAGVESWCARLGSLALLIALCASCSDDSAQTRPLAGADASSEAAVDAATEEPGAGKDAGTDVIEAGQDALHEAGDSALDSTGDEPLAQDGTADVQDDSADAAEATPSILGIVSVQALAAELSSKDFLLINVHVPYAGEIPKTDANLTYLDMAAIKAYIGPNLNSKVVVYCLSNYMSGIAGHALVADGYSNVRYLDGGLSAWQNAGNPVEFHDQ
jgi:rhodanese-related sulfurtransferase